MSNPFPFHNFDCLICMETKKLLSAATQLHTLFEMYSDKSQPMKGLGILIFVCN